MFDRLKTIFQGAGRQSARAAPDDDARLAVAALLVEAARADEQYDAREQGLIEAALAADFSLDAAAARALRLRGEEAQRSASDLHRFTRIAKALPDQEKIRLVEHLWRIALSDGARDQYEDAFVRRVCGLIYVSDVDSGAARRRVASQSQTSSG